MEKTMSEKVKFIFDNMHKFEGKYKPTPYGDDFNGVKSKADVITGDNGTLEIVYETSNVLSSHRTMSLHKEVRMRVFDDHDIRFPHDGAPEHNIKPGERYVIVWLKKEDPQGEAFQLSTMVDMLNFAEVIEANRVHVPQEGFIGYTFSNDATLEEIYQKAIEVSKK